MLCYHQGQSLYQKWAFPVKKRQGKGLYHSGEVDIVAPSDPEARIRKREKLGRKVVCRHNR
ncbi:hypothetical protein C8D90_102452 [Enterobacillus tribolii]|uniref:Uncharacterized protein n=1 Tax=Enterobacillus tribolii TaxID=1487935 RepID=A0A370R348_9GAMM|nr:hypothetical protein C8D90_102452 [Enterobacillus tribolii]